MKVLTIQNAKGSGKNVSGIDLWRIHRPWRELAKHVDWQIDSAPSVIKGIEKFKDKKEFTQEELEESGKWLGTYDIIHSSYFTNPAQFSLLMAVKKLYGTKFIMDIDDNLFAINPDNPFWLRHDHEDVFNMQQMIKHADYITTTSDDLARELRKRREQKDGTVMVVPNYLPKDYKEYDPDNADKIVIGYFGGSSHYRDIHETGVIEAVERIMHKYKNVEFKVAGMILDKYVPKGRYTEIEAEKGKAWTDKIYPSLQFDISLGPLEDTVFARGKSHIKWMESTRMGAAFICSDVGPYKKLRNGHNAICVPNNTESWEYALDELVSNAKKRKELVKEARADLKKYWCLEDHWDVLKKAVESVNTKIILQ